MKQYQGTLIIILLATIVALISLGGFEHPSYSASYDYSQPKGMKHSTLHIEPGQEKQIGEKIDEWRLSDPDNRVILDWKPVSLPGGGIEIVIEHYVLLKPTFTRDGKESQASASPAKPDETKQQ